MVEVTGISTYVILFGVDITKGVCVGFFVFSCHVEPAQWNC